MKNFGMATSKITSGYTLDGYKPNLSSLTGHPLWQGRGWEEEMGFQQMNPSAISLSSSLCL